MFLGKQSINQEYWRITRTEDIKTTRLTCLQYNNILQSFYSNNFWKLQGVPKKMSHSWEPKKLGTSYSETKHLLDLKLRQQGALMSTPCSQSLRPNRCVVSEYEVPNFLCSQEWDIFLGTPCSITLQSVVLHCHTIFLP